MFWKKWGVEQVPSPLAWLCPWLGWWLCQWPGAWSMSGLQSLCLRIWFGMLIVFFQWWSSIKIPLWKSDYLGMLHSFHSCSRPRCLCSNLTSPYLSGPPPPQIAYWRYLKASPIHSCGNANISKASLNCTIVQVIATGWASLSTHYQSIYLWVAWSVQLHVGCGDGIVMDQSGGK